MATLSTMQWYHSMNAWVLVLSVRHFFSPFRHLIESSSEILPDVHPWRSLLRHLWWNLASSSRCGCALHSDVGQSFWIPNGGGDMDPLSLLDYAIKNFLQFLLRLHVSVSIMVVRLVSMWICQAFRRWAFTSGLLMVVGIWTHSVCSTMPSTITSRSLRQHHYVLVDDFISSKYGIKGILFTWS